VTATQLRPARLDTPGMKAFLCVAGALALVACHGKSAAVCKNLEKQCGVEVPSTCASDLADAVAPLGHDGDRALSCIADASSCAEAVGCVQGTAERLVERWQREMAKGEREARGSDEPRDDDTQDDTRVERREHHETHDIQVEHHESHADTDPDAPPVTCTEFAAKPAGATWTGCSDHARRELACKPFMDDDLECTCLVDGVEAWLFTAKDPPITTHDDASRVARTNCKMGSFDGL
jgi:hypothetical protein